MGAHSSSKINWEGGEACMEKSTWCPSRLADLKMVRKAAGGYQIDLHYSFLEKVVLC